MSGMPPVKLISIQSYRSNQRKSLIGKSKSNSKIFQKHAVTSKLLNSRDEQFYYLEGGEHQKPLPIPVQVYLGNSVMVLQLSYPIQYSIFTHIYHLSQKKHLDSGGKFKLGLNIPYLSFSLLIGSFDLLTLSICSFSQDVNDGGFVHTYESPNKIPIYSNICITQPVTIFVIIICFMSYFDFLTNSSLTKGKAVIIYRLATLVMQLRNQINRTLQDT